MEAYGIEFNISDTLLYSSMILIGLATFRVVLTFFQDENEYKAKETIEEGSQSKKDDYASHGIILRYSRPFFKRYVSPIVSGMKKKRQIREKYKRPLASAGLTGILTPDDFYSFKIFLIVGFPIVFLFLRTFLEEDWDMSYMFILAILGFFYPDIWISGKIKKRQKELIYHMPFAVDLLALAVEAGLDFIAAMTKVIDKAKPSALTQEFEIVMRDIKVGASRAEALRSLAWRTDIIQMASFCATLIAADSVGASIGPILKSLSAEIRQKRSADIEKAGATAATKILVPLIFFIVPAVFIVVMAPIGLEAVYANK